MPQVTHVFSASVQGRLLGDVWVVTIDHPPVNALSTEVRAGLIAALQRAETDPAICAMVILGAGKTFIGGADIQEFGKPAVDPALPAVVAAIENAEKPVVAALNGAALGGGLEVALAAHGRIAVEGATLALPEVKLGLVPGAGGTQRLPRLIGALEALKMIATGGVMTAVEAQKAGLINRLGDDLLEEAVAFARSLAGKPLRRTSALTVRPPEVSLFEQARRRIVGKARGAAAPRDAARLIALSWTVPFDEALAEERATFLRLRDSDEAAALRHLFFAERAAGKIEGLACGTRSLFTIGIAGTGLMGAGIAAVCLAAGYRVIGYEQTPEAAETGRARILDLMAKAVSAGKSTLEAAEAQQARLIVTADPRQLTASELVLEAVFDDFEVKSALFRQLDALLPPETILATNTSYLDPEALAKATNRPERVLGLHFFSPANLMRLVEVVRCAQTSDETLATGVHLVRTLKKLPIVTGVGEGFIGNRIFSAYRAEAEILLAEGAYPEDIDRAMENYGFPMGLFAVNDMAGLEIAWARRKRLAATRDPHAPYFDVADKLCEAGRFGRKTGRGWYLYEGGARTCDPEVHALIDAYRARNAIVPHPFSEAEIVRRLLAVMVREGQTLLDMGIARHPDDIDLVLVNGYGFPSTKGGPMFAARRASL